MMHLIKILFLGISIFFSFGFTTYQANCGTQENKIEVNAHSCCHSNKKPSCTKSSDCLAECCLKPNNIFVFNQFIISVEEIIDLTILESIRNVDINFYLVPISNLESKKVINNYQYLSPKISGRYIIDLKQAWLL
tara:strand:+ start:286 stop:690 length:405 start_codon:yes stop_codon:yes gene_type:complete